MSNGLSSTQLTLKEAIDVYENGKHRRYNLLFSVNGGVFAIAKLLTGELGKQSVILGKLTLAELAFGMAIFTVVMATDIYIFGNKMRSDYLRDAFGPVGKVVLVLLAALLCIGWLLVGIQLGNDV